LTVTLMVVWSNPEEVLEEYYRASIEGCMTYDILGTLFCQLVDILEKKLAEHALVGEKEFRELDTDNWYDVYQKIRQAVTEMDSVDWFIIDPDDVDEAIAHIRYNTIHDTFVDEPPFDELQKLYAEVLPMSYAPRDYPQLDLIVYIEKMLNAKHKYGYLTEWEWGFDHIEVRMRVEEEYE